MGYSRGGTLALACGALLPDRVVAVVSAAGIAPFGAEGLDWYAGMIPSGVASLTAAAQGLKAKEAHEAAARRRRRDHPQFARPMAGGALPDGAVAARPRRRAHPPARGGPRGGGLGAGCL